MNSLRFADDSTLIAGRQQGLQDLLHEIVEKSRNKGLEINRKKTVCVAISKKTSPHCTLLIGNDKIQQVDKFKYLCSCITGKGHCDIEIERRIGTARETLDRLDKILKDLKMTMTRLRVLHCYGNLTLLCGCECRTVSKAMEKKLEAAEMWFLRRILRISWTDRVTKEELLRKAGVERSLLRRIPRRRQMKFLGHIARKDWLEKWY